MPRQLMPSHTHKAAVLQGLARSPVCMTRILGQQSRAMACRTMEKADKMRLWLPMRAPRVAMTKQGQKTGRGIALK